MSKNKTVLDLCGGTGSWSLPYQEAGYNVKLVTLPDYDVKKWKKYTELRELVLNNKIHGILATPPCPMFSHARTVAKEPRDTKKAMRIVKACLNIIWESQHKVETGEKKTPLKFWALENPYHSILPQFLGEPAFDFDPWEFGDPYQKRTALWGYFNNPEKKYENKKEIMKHKTNSQEPPRLNKKFDRLKDSEIAPKHLDDLSRKERRAITPQGFAKAFYEVNK